MEQAALWRTPNYEGAGKQTQQANTDHRPYSVTNVRLSAYLSQRPPLQRKGHHLGPVVHPLVQGASSIVDRRLLVHVWVYSSCNFSILRSIYVQLDTTV